MTMQAPDPITAMIESEEQNTVHTEVSAVGAIVRSEAEAQIDCAHRYPRKVSRFLQESMTLATISQEIAEACIYSLPRAGDVISGPSVRLAEIMASAYGNLHFGARIVDEDETHVTAQGVAWDLEKNVRVTLEIKRRITNRQGRRFNDDMITVTSQAAASIALRNAIFRVVPRAYVNSIYERVRKVAVGDASTLDRRRREVLERLRKIGVPTERALAKLERDAIEDVTLDDVEALIGLGTAVKDGGNVDEIFPPVTAAPAPPQEDGKRIGMKGKGKGKAKDSNQPTDADQPEREPGEEG